MATELVTRIWCDVHLESKDEHVTAQPYEHQGYQVDLCPDCAGPFVEVQRLIDEHGRREGKRKYRKQGNGHAPAQPAASELQCPDCTYLAKNKGALASHGRRMHGKTLGELLGLPTPFKCEECGTRFTNGAGLHAHQRKGHLDA